MDTFLIIQFWLYSRHPRSFNTHSRTQIDHNHSYESSHSIVHPQSIPIKYEPIKDTGHKSNRMNRNLTRTDSWDTFAESMSPLVGNEQSKVVQYPASTTKIEPNQIKILLAMSGLFIFTRSYESGMMQYGMQDINQVIESTNENTLLLAALCGYISAALYSMSMNLKF